MIVIDSGQMRQLDADVKTRFADKLTGQLQAEYPDRFRMLPAALAKRILAGKIDYAEDRYQIRYQNALTAYLHYCCAIAPAFDLQPDIQAVLDDLSLYPDDIPGLLVERVSDQAWAEAAQNARRSDWFVSRPEHLADQVAARTCWAVADLAVRQSREQGPPEDAALSGFIAQSMQAAGRFRIVDAKGLTAFAVCQSLLGMDFYRQSARPWLAYIFNDAAILPELRGSTLAGCVELEWKLEL